MQGRIRAGWRQLTKVFGFCEEVRLSSLRHFDLRIQVKVFPRYGVVTEAPPAFSDSSGQVEDTRLIIIRPDGAEDGDLHDLLALGTLVRQITRRPVQWTVHDVDQLTLNIELLDQDDRFNSELPWKVGISGAPTAHYVDHLWGTALEHTEGAPATTSFETHRMRQEYDLQILFVARPPELRRGPVERAWLERHFVWGGLPELGRNR